MWFYLVAILPLIAAVQSEAVDGYLAPRHVPTATHGIPKPILRPTYIRPVQPTKIEEIKPVPKPLPEPVPTLPPQPVQTRHPKFTVAPRPIVTPRPVTLKPYEPAKFVPDVDNAGGILVDFNCLQDGFYGFPNECDSYIKCSGSTAVKFSCPDGLFYNKNIRYPEYPCTYPTEVKCEAGSVAHEARPTADCPHRYGLFPLNDGDCSRYISCQEGLATVMDCPHGLVFNPQKVACDWVENVPNCMPFVFRGFSCPAVSGDDQDLTSKYRYGRSCKYYVACHRGYPRLLGCDAGLAFNEASESCVDAAKISNCED